MSILVSIDGHVVPQHEARVSVFDTGFTFGDSVYETLRTYDGRPHALERHLRRLRRSAERLGFTPPDDAVLRERLAALLAAAGNAESYVRWIVSRGVGDLTYRFERVQGPTVVMVVKPLEPLPERYHAEGVAAAIVDIRRNPPWALDPAIKSSNLLNNVLATREAQARGAYEAILLNGRGEVAEGAGSNVFVVEAGRLVTPPLEAGLLAGITRELVLEQAAELGIEADEAPLAPAALVHADEAFFTSTLKEVLPIATLDGRPLGSGRPGPLTLRLLEAYRRHAHAH